MQKTPKGLRLHIGIFGRRNVGKSSILNGLTRQNVSIVSEFKGTTTDPVEKPMELLPLGPVVFIDTAGVDDEGDLGNLRVERTQSIFARCDLALIVTDDRWASYEKAIAEALKSRNIPWIAVLNKADVCAHEDMLATLRGENIQVVSVSAQDTRLMDVLKQAIIQAAPAEYMETRQIIGDLIPEHGHVVLVVPIDKEAPKGRLILPQVQTIRDILDAHATCTVCQEPQLARVLDMLKMPPAMVVTDSQAFGSVSRIVPPEIMLTGFSVLFARFKGELTDLVRGARAIKTLKPNDRVLIAEACTHHPIQDDIGRVKIPNWLRREIDPSLQIDVLSGPDFPEDLTQYQLIIHCGACMWTRRQFLSRQQQAMAQNVPMTNYGVAIAALHHILDRALEPFPEALSVWQQ